MLNDGSITDDKRVISESFNNFFYQYWTNLSQIHPNYQKCPIDSMGVRVMESLYLKPVTCEEMNNILVSLKYTACGWDNISAVVLRLSSQFIVQPCTFVYMQPISD